MLPDGNGLELLEELRESPVKRVVFITGHPGIKSLIKNLSGPSVSYLTKPIGSTELLRTVETDSESPAQRERGEPAAIALRVPDRRIAGDAEPSTSRSRRSAGRRVPC